MGFFDQYKDEGGLAYIGAEEKAALSKAQTVLPIVRAWHGEGQFGPKYVAIVEVDGEERAMSFGAGTVESRDRMFDALIEYFDSEEDVAPVNVVLTKVKQSWILKDATKVEA